MTAAARVTYVGHATVLVELDGVRLLTDPVLRRRVGPLRRHGAASRPAAGGGRRRGADLPPAPRPRRPALAAPARQEVPVLAPPGAGGLLRAARLRRRPRAGPRRVRQRRRRPRHRHRGRPRRPAGGASSATSRAVGFLLAGQRRIYFAGDTDLFDGMEAIAAASSTSRCCRSGAGARTSAPGHLDPERAARAAALLEPQDRRADPLGDALPARPRAAAPRAAARSAARARRAGCASWRLRSELRVLAPGESTSLA